MINVVLIGAGKIAESFHIPALKKLKLIKIVGIIDKDISKAKKLAEKYKIKYFSAKLNKILNQTKVEVVDICASNDAHEQIIMECLNKNLHIICEKPFVTNHKLISKIKRVSEKKKLVCVAAQHQRFRLASILLKRKIEKKKFGKVYFVDVNSLYKKSHTVNNINHIKRNSNTGLLLDLGSHFFDLVLWLLNNPKPYSVTANASKIFSKNLLKQNKLNKNFKVHDFCNGLIKFENNLSINFKFSYLSNLNVDRKEEFKIFAEKSNVVWPELHVTKFSSKKIRKIGKKEKILASNLMFKDFFAKIKKGRKIKNNFNVQINTLKLINALNKSIIKKRTIYFENK